MTEQLVAPVGGQNVTGIRGRLSRLALIDLRISTIAFWALLAIGLALRIVLLFTNSYVLDSDNSVVFLLSKHISEGEITWFFWGQTYGGTLLELAAGGAMVVFGPHVQVLGIVGALFFAVATVLLRQIASLAFGRPVVGNVAGVLFWFSGYWMARVGFSEPGFYGPSLMLGLLVIWLALRGDRKKSYLQWALIGLATGLALWQSPMGVAIAAPAVLVAVIRQFSPTRYLVGAAAAVLGALPWLIVFFTSDTAVKPQRDTPIGLVNFATFFTRVLPGAFSLSETGPRYATAFVALALLALLVVLAVVRRSWWLGTLLVSTGAVVIVVVLGTGAVLDQDSLRYAIFVLPALAVAIAWIATLLPFTGLVAMALAVGLSIGQTYTLFPQLRLTDSPTYIIGDIDELGDYLEEQGITAAYADYWVSYAVTAETGERVKAATISGPRRYAPYETDAANAPVATVIVLLDNENDKALNGNPDMPPSTRTVVADYAIYTYQQPFDAFSYGWQLF
ncbi:hypothetical protein B7R54_03755 [Subtercola boreus]|uniref:Glycosyltransferase RgtA/B/C/D-like domain-containing protein n=1 Tax=Subtercola boreus TaxID=120213 RepID=A0A3E0VES5_9MICO|nr:hypothetical protein [Subtercola boreus]RFA08436.1 hypothetical protein B7R54_03755 [Subtercola boreus]TQL54649.1 hypothetical protein FB464_2191 [Subtercola boreus]